MQTRPTTSLDPARISDLIQKDGLLQLIYRKNQLIQTANQIFATIMSTSARQHCHIAQIENGLITVMTDSGAWATQVRYYQNILLDAFKQHPPFRHVVAVKTRVKKSFIAAPTRQSQAPAKMSEKTGRLLQESANTVTHPALKAALLKLAKNGVNHD